jgi:hypothetical protein
MVPCNNPGCKDRVEFASAVKHEKELCGYRQTSCKFQPLGCDWTGLAHKLPTHEKECEIRNKKPSKLLKRVLKRNAVKQVELKKVEDSASAQRDVCKLLSARCKEIAIRDVVLERDTLCEETCSKTFTALGLAWEAVLTKSTEPKLGIRLRIVSALKRKLQLQVFILSGANFEMELPATVHKLIYRRKTRVSGVLELGVTPEQATALYERQESINLRIGFVDQSRGRIQGSFTTSIPAGASTSSSDSSDDEPLVDYSDDDSSSGSGHSHQHDHDHDHRDGYSSEDFTDYSETDFSDDESSHVLTFE